jgi:MYXO-CTERM domain-containing protein
MVPPWDDCDLRDEWPLAADLIGDLRARVAPAGCMRVEAKDRAAQRVYAGMMRSVVTWAALALAVAVPRAASAFCGFYVAGSDQQMFNDATQVVLMRMGTRTVLSMQNNYQGPPEAFAMVVPVPVVLHEGDVKTLPREVFERVEQMGAPRLVEYWEQDPCAVPAERDDRRRLPMPTTAANKSGGEVMGSLGVTIEAKFTVGEYQVVILSAKDSTGLATWLAHEKYKIPAGAEPLLRPYVEGGSKFFVAKVDPAKVAFDRDGRAALSPLRFHYDAEELSLPIRLGLASSSGTQDLIVNILAPRQRYEVSNYHNVTIPTNLDVSDAVKARFPAFYAALFDRTLERNPGAVVTEYAWQASSCDPCPGPRLTPGDFATLGADVLGGGLGRPGTPSAYDLVLTRLHARYGKTLTDDLRFREAPPIVGGREIARNGQGLEEGAQPAPQNNFQGRYAIRHPWTGPIRCENPRRKIWGGPPMEIAQQPGVPYGRAQPAVNLAFASRGEVQLSQVVTRSVPELGIVVGTVDDAASASGATGSGGPAAKSPGRSEAKPARSEGRGEAKPRSGCGCAAAGSGDALGGAWIGLAIVAGAARRRRRRGARR